jgi:uncharacterized protein involved in cysteine biosynthesis
MGNPPDTAGLHELIAAPAQTRRRQYLAGLSAPWLGLRVLWLRPGLWKYAIVPIVLNLLITVIAILAMLVMAAGMVALLHWLTSGWKGTWFYVAIILQVLGAAAMVMLCIGAAVIVWRLLSGILCGYFYSRLAARIERELGVGKDELRDVTLWQEVRDTLADLGWLLLSLLLALLMALVPLVGPPLALAYSLYFQVLTCGRTQFSYPLALRGMARPARLVFCREHAATTLGMGTVVLALEFVPVVGAILMVTSAAGGVILHRRVTQAASI